MSQKETQGDIQELAVRLCKLYHEKKNDQITDEELLSDGDLLELRNQLIDAIVASLKDDRDMSDRWIRTCHYVIRTIPRYRFDASEEEYNEFSHFFMKCYFKNLDQVEDLGDDEKQRYQIKRTLGGNPEDIRRLQQIMQFCNANNLQVDRLTDEDLEKIKKALPRFSIKMIRRLITIEYRFANMEYIDAMEDENDHGLPGEQAGFFQDDPESFLSLMDMLGTLTEECLKKNQREIVKCIYTNRFAGEMRDYTKTDRGEGYEKATSEQERQSLRARYLDDQFEVGRDKLYEQVLHLGYLSYVLEEPTPDRIYRICMNPYRVDENGERDFTDETVERFRGMSKGNIKKTYRPKVDEILHLLKEYCREFN